MGLFADRWAL